MQNSKRNLFSLQIFFGGVLRYKKKSPQPRTKFKNQQFHAGVIRNLCHFREVTLSFISLDNIHFVKIKKVFVLYSYQQIGEGEKGA